jgi:hypothetical protein
MNKAAFDQYIREYVREALIFGDKNVEEVSKNIFSLQRPATLVCVEMPGDGLGRVGHSVKLTPY